MKRKTSLALNEKVSVNQDWLWENKPRKRVLILKSKQILKTKIKTITSSASLTPHKPILKYHHQILSTWSVHGIEFGNLSLSSFWWGILSSLSFFWELVIGSIKKYRYESTSIIMRLIICLSYEALGNVSSHYLAVEIFSDYVVWTGYSQGKITIG